MNGMKENDQQLSYEDVLILAKGCYDLAFENYALESYSEILPNQNLLAKAAKLLRSVEKQGYNDHLWCGLLGDILTRQFLIIVSQTNLHNYLLNVTKISD